MKRAKLNEIESAVEYNKKVLAKYEADLNTLRAGGSVQHLSIEGAEKTIDGLRSSIENCQRLLAMGRTKFQ